MGSFEEMLRASTGMAYYDKQLAPDVCRVVLDIPESLGISEGQRYKQCGCVSQGMDKLLDYVRSGRLSESEVPILVHIEKMSAKVRVKRVSYEMKAGPDGLARYSGGWGCIAFSQCPHRFASYGGYGVMLACALAAMGYLPDGVSNIVCLIDNPEWVKKLGRAKIACLYSQSHAGQTGALIPENAVEVGKKASFSDIDPLCVGPDGIKLNFYSKYQFSIDSYLECIMAYRQWQAVSRGINEALGTSSHFPSTELYPALVGEELYKTYGVPYADGTMNAGHAALGGNVACMLGIEYDSELGARELPECKLEVPMSSDACRRCLDSVNAKYREVSLVLDTWSKFMRAYGIILKVYPEGGESIQAVAARLAKVRDVLGLDSAIEAVLSDAPLDYIEP